MRCWIRTPCAGVHIAAALALAALASGCELVAGVTERRLGDSGATGTSGSGGGMSQTSTSSAGETTCGPMMGQGKHLWSVAIGDTADQHKPAVAIASAGYPTVVGSFGGTLVFDGSTYTFGGDQNLFVASYKPKGDFHRGLAFEATQSEPRIAFDDASNLYLAGTYQDTIDFTGTPLPSFGGEDVYLAAFDSMGQPLWAKRFGDAEDQGVGALTVGIQGRLVLVGWFRGQMPAACPAELNAQSALPDAFVMKLDNQGNCLWSRALSGAGSQRAETVAVDVDGHVLVGGVFRDEIDFGNGDVVSVSSDDAAFVAKIAFNGNSLSWRKVLSGAAGSSVVVRSLATASSGDVFVAGDFRGEVDFGGGPRKSEDPQLTAPGGGDAFVVAFDPDGAWKWDVILQGEGSAAARALAVDPKSGAIWVAGDFDGVLQFGGVELTSNGGAPAGGIVEGSGDVFLIRLDDTGAVGAAGCFGDTALQRATGLSIFGSFVNAGAVAITGENDGTIDFGGGPLASVTGDRDVFLAVMDP